jgi:exopolysaccharide biosynthesis protein
LNFVSIDLIDVIMGMISDANFDISKSAIMVINYLTIIVSFLIFITMAGTTSIVTRSEKMNIIQSNIMEQTNIYLGMWVTADGHIRQQLLPNGRYDEARGSKKSAYTGKYEIKGNHIMYWRILRNWCI